MESKKEILAKIDKTNEQISNSPIIKGLIDGGLSLIPFLGSAISSSLDTRAFQLFEENSRKFAEEIQQIIGGLDENKIDKEFLESPEFTSILIATLSRNAHTYQQEKIKVFAKIFVSFFTLPESKASYKEGFIQIIEELDIDHIRILGFIFERANNPIENDERLVDRVLADDISSNLQIPLGRTLAYCQQLLKFGLVRDWGVGKFGQYKPDKFAITDYGSELAQLLISNK
ncbi:MAG: hypothetical protein HOP27_13040 [Anaerolineales bacterium]|nr:hypothetical protein [Anaerolineales bacterium]